MRSDKSSHTVLRSIQRGKLSIRLAGNLCTNIFRASVQHSRDSSSAPERPHRRHNEGKEVDAQANCGAECCACASKLGARCTLGAGHVFKCAMWHVAKPGSVSGQRAGPPPAPATPPLSIPPGLP
jgi:hypothetical protein